jgi:uncharacterized protein YbjT (DUF2867 family)
MNVPGALHCNNNADLQRSAVRGSSDEDAELRKSTAERKQRTEASRVYNSHMRVIITGVTGMVGEGVLLECLENDAVEKVLAVSRKPTNHTHPKLEQLLVPDFRNASDVEAKLTGYDACFYCAGVSSIGMSEADYTVIAYDTPVAFATTLARLNPTMVFTYVTGASTDSTEQGKTMWARVKGRAENALIGLPFKGVYNFRPGLMTPKPGQKHLKTSYRVALAESSSSVR